MGNATGKRFNTYSASSPTIRPKREFFLQIGFQERGYPKENPNPKWVTSDPKSASNRVPIREIYFGLIERYNPNMSILSPVNLFTERILFLDPVVGEDAE